MRRWIISVAAVGLLLGSGVQAGAVSAQGTLTGVFSVIFGDPPPGSSLPPQVLYRLTDDTGKTTELRLSGGTLQAAGGTTALNRQRVTVTGAPTTQADGATAITVQTIKAEAKTSSTVSRQDLTTGAQPFINVLCQFPDKPNLPVNPVTPAYVTGLMGATFPGLGDFFAQASFNAITLDGTLTTNWRTMPHPESSCPSIGSSNGLSDADFTSLFNDCTSLIPSTVDMSRIKGINLLFNDLPGPYAYGGQGQRATINTVNQLWSSTWMPPWGYSVQPDNIGGQTVLAHEMGHAFGLLHSAGPTGVTYKNAWDVLSDTYVNCGLPNATDVTYGCLGQHMIAYDKDFLGWIPAAKKFTYAGAGQTLTFGALADASTPNVQIAVIPHIGTTTQFTTVEFRQRIGYDRKLIGDAIIIHEVNTTRTDPAWVVGTDGNAGAMFMARRTYLVPNSGVLVTINTIVGTTASVTIGPPPAPMPPVRTVPGTPVPGVPSAVPGDTRPGTVIPGSTPAPMPMVPR